MATAEIFEMIQQNRSGLIRFGLSRIGLFSSQIRGNATAQSDIDFIVKHIGSLQPGHFMHDSALERAAVRSIEIIGEAVRSLPDELLVRYPGVEWLIMTTTRNRLIHGYFSVDIELVWDVVVSTILNNQVASRFLREETTNVSRLFYRPGSYRVFLQL